MEAEEVLKLFDSYWFEPRISTHKHNLLPQDEIQESDFSGSSITLQKRSLSDLGLNPKREISSPKLQKILSGKEVEFEEIVQEKNEKYYRERKKNRDQRKAGKMFKRSLSALEIDEVKGFIDLGFVFSEEDKNSNLVSIIPGLQNWGTNEKKVEVFSSRPYLSEAWGDLNQKRVYNNMMKWKIRSANNEINLKDHLKVWAQTVASTVR
ncbi:hypothetical protein ACJIZ3_010611 [Penstemon smallii]|uniref:Uncharacterized protein n=1 Tax=Penstemon smallii TaxID=265156 RepID=A0ABD3UGT2_9LAMI